MTKIVPKVLILTESRYLHPVSGNDYIDNILLEDKILMEALQTNGISSKRIAWDDQNHNWETPQIAIFRAVWDYFERFEEFMNWYQTAQQNIVFINPYSIIDWNIDKHYLKDLEEKGVRIPKTQILEKGSGLSLAQALELAKNNCNLKGDEFILKPCIAGAARHTYRFKKEDIPKLEVIFLELTSSEAMMIQEFQHKIVSEGELSLMMMDGQYTHAVRKKAKKGDFRVQDDFGGSVHPHIASESEIQFALNTLDACPEKPLYARVDIFKDNEDKIALGELELFEPELWFRLFPEAANVLARGIYKTHFS